MTKSLILIPGIKFSFHSNPGNGGLMIEYSDFVSQIKRCEERIQDGIMPWLFEKKLEDFKGLKMDKE